MPLTAHDAEERSRQIIGFVMDAREKVSDTADAWRTERLPDTADALIAAQRELINRQDDLIAELREQVRQATEPYPRNPDEVRAQYEGGVTYQREGF